jgi:hypothetical protein
MSGSTLARTLGWRQPRVSRLETGAQFPTEGDLTVWATATNAAFAVNELVKLREIAQREHAAWQEVARHSGGVPTQGLLGSREWNATVVKGFRPATIPGLLQTAAYGHEVMGAPGGPASWEYTGAPMEVLSAARVRRQALLYQEGRRFEFVLCEGALRHRYGSAATLAQQLNRLSELAELATVKLHVIPFSTALPAAPLGMFTVYDDAEVVLDLLTGEYPIVDPEQVAVYVNAYNHLRSAALAGGDAMELIRQIASELRATTV